MKICGHRLLIVEDEPLLRITMADALRKEGWAVDVAEDGVKGAAQFEQHQHDLVLTDLVMPRLGGIELLKRISLGRSIEKPWITNQNDVDRELSCFNFLAKLRPISMTRPAA